MADRDRDRPHPHQLQVHPQRRHDGGVKTLLPERGPSAQQVMALLAGLPVGGTLLALAGITLVGTFIALALATPVFLIFSPVLVPTAIVIGGAVLAIMTSGAFGLTGLSSLSWVMNLFRQSTPSVHDQMEMAKRRMQDMADFVGQKTKDVGQGIQNTAHEGVGTKTTT